MFLTSTNFSRAFANAAVFALLAAPLHSAFAQERTPQTKAVFGAMPVPCLAQMTQLMNRQLFRLGPDQILAGMREPLGKGAAWTRGDPNYERVRAIILRGLLEGEKKHGPLFNLSEETLLATIVEGWNPDQQRHYAAFFARPAGKLYLSDMLEGAHCDGSLEGLNKAPYLPFEGADKVKFEQLIAGLQGGSDRFLVKYRRLSAEEQKVFTAELDPVNKAVNAAQRAVPQKFDDILMKRVSEAILPLSAEIQAAANSKP